MVLFLFKFDSMQPHQSYLILKQREMVSQGLDDKELRLLDTVDHTTLPSPLNGQGLHSTNRNAIYNTYQSGHLFNGSIQEREHNSP